MSSRNFLALCSEVVSDLGVAGGSLSTTLVAQLATEQQRIVNWVARADLQVQNLWTDWTFLWYLDKNVTCAANTDFAVLDPPSNAEQVDRLDNDTFYVNYGTSSAMKLTWMDWEKFYNIYQIRPKATGLYPTFYSRDPTGTVWFDRILTQATTFALAYWYTGNAMVNPTDVSPIPYKFDRIIVERAKILYAQRENAPEIMAGSTAEYTDLLDKMQAFYLPNNYMGRTSRNDRTTSPRLQIG